MFHVFLALAEFERDVIRERSLAGLHAARERGRLGGRPRVMTPKKLKLAVTLMQARDVSIKEICRNLDISKTTLYRHLP